MHNRLQKSKTFSININDVSQHFADMNLEPQTPTAIDKSFFNHRDHSDNKDDFQEQSTQLQAQSNGDIGGTCGTKRLYSQREPQEETKDGVMDQPTAKRFQR